MKPIVPERPRSSQNQRDFPGDNSEAKPEGEKDNMGTEDSKKPQEQSDSNSGKTDPVSPKCDSVSEKPDETSQKNDQNSENVQNVEGSIGNAELGNTLNNFLEICTKSMPDSDNFSEEISGEIMVPGDVQDNDTDIAEAESSGKESSSSEGSGMGETKYKEITEEPEEPIADGGNPDRENKDCGSAGSENAAIIPGLQEIQEGLVKDDDDAIKDEMKLDGDVSVKHGESLEDKSKEAPPEKVEIIPTEINSSLENDTTGLYNGFAHHEDTPSVTQVSSPSKNTISGDKSSEDSSQKGTVVSAENETTDELLSEGKNITIENE